MTGIYRGKVSRNTPFQIDHWRPPEDQPYPVVILADAGPDFDHTGMPVLVVADPDRGDGPQHVSINDDLDGYTDWWLAASAKRGRPIAGWITLIRRLQEALRTTLAQRDEWNAKWQRAQDEMDEPRWRAVTEQRRAIRAETRVTELEAAGERLMVTHAPGWENKPAVDARKGWRALVSPPTAPDPTENPHA